MVTRGGDTAAALHIAAVAHQPHHAAVGADAAGVDHAGVVDQVGEQILGCRGLQHHGASFGLEGAGVADCRFLVVQALLQFAGDLDVDQAVAVEVEHGVFGAVEVDAAVVGQDHAVVGHAATDQCDGAAAGGLDQAVIDDARARAGGVEAVIAGEEILRREVQRAGHQAADIHLGRGTEDDAVGIDQEDLAVGVDLAEDLAGVLIEDAIERHRRAAGLVEQHRFVGLEVEGFPVQRQSLRDLVDHRLVAVLGDAAGAADHRAAGGAAGEGVGGDGDRADREPDAQADRPRPAQRQAARGQARDPIRRSAVARFTPGADVLAHVVVIPQNVKLKRV